MRRPRLRWVLLALVVVGAAVVGGLAWYVLAGSTPGKPHLSTTATTDVAPGTSSPDGAWTIARGKDVYVGYRMSEQFAGNTFSKDAVGRTPSVDGTMTIASGHVTAATVTADLRQLSSDRAPRDNYIHRHALETDTFPTARYELAAPLTLPPGVRPGQKVRVQATGRLTLHGVTRTVTMGIEARWDGSAVEVVGTAPILLADYRIEPPNTSIVSTADHGSLELQLTFHRTR